MTGTRCSGRRGGACEGGYQQRSSGTALRDGRENSGPDETQARNLRALSVVIGALCERAIDSGQGSG